MVNNGCKINNQTKLTVTAYRNNKWQQASSKPISLLISAPTEENIKQSFAASKEILFFLSFLWFLLYYNKKLSTRRICQYN